MTRFGISGVETAGKTGTAERGPGLKPHSWFIGFAPAQDGAQPSIAIAVIVEGGGSGSETMTTTTFDAGCARQKLFDGLRTT